MTITDDHQDAFDRGLQNDGIGGEATHLALEAKALEQSDPFRACMRARDAAKKNCCYVLWSEQFVGRVNRAIASNL